MLGGAVEVPLCLSDADMRALPPFELDCVIACAGNPPGGLAFGQARWQGVPMTALLAEVQVQPGVAYAHLYAADGYSSSITYQQLQQALLVYGMNGSPLTPEHGFPARLIVPGLHGYKMPKWLQRVILAETPLEGFWERRGWSQTGETPALAAIQNPVHLQQLSGLTLLQGYAYSGKGPIRRVEISINDGPWVSVPFRQPAPHSAAQWHAEWTPTSPGEHRISVRASDGTPDAVSQPDHLHAITIMSRLL